MATAQERLNALLAQRQATQPNVGGVPLDQALQPRNAAEAQQQAALIQGQRRAEEIVRADFEQQGTPIPESSQTAAERLAELQARKGPVADGNPLIATSPRVKTGNEALDKRGEVRERRFTGALGIGALPGRERTFPEDFEFDSQEAIMLQRAKEGVRFDKGLPVMQRLRMAQNSSIPRAKAMVLQEMFSDLPEGVDPKFDTALQQWYVPIPITQDDVSRGQEAEEDLGKYRYVAMDEEQLSFADMADMTDPAEWLSIGLSIAGTGKFGKVIGVPFAGIRGASAEVAGQSIAASFGRLGGEGMKIVFDYVATDGEFAPTQDELIDLGYDSVQTEILASLLGEIGSRGLGLGTDAVQEMMARVSGREGATGTAEDIAISNQNIAKSRKDLGRIHEVTGANDYTMTRGEATGSIDMVESEKSFLRTASPVTLRQEELRNRRNARDAAQFIDEQLGGIDPTAGMTGVVTRANHAFNNQNVIVAQVDKRSGVGTTLTGTGGGSTRITFSPKADPDNGLRVMPNGRDGGLEDAWQVVGVRLEPHHRGTGIADDLYLSAAQEARAHNRRLVSDDRISEDGVKVWRRLQDSGAEEFSGITVNKSGTEEFVDGEGRKWFSTNDGLPMFETAKRDPLLPQLLTPENMRPKVKPDGTVVEPSVISSVFRGAGKLRNLSAQMFDEAGANRFLAQDLKEAFFQDYKLSVRDPKTGAFDPKRFAKWKQETGGFVDKMFTPEETLAIQRAGGLREVVTNGRFKLAEIQTSLRNTMDLRQGFNFKDPGVQGSLYNQWKKLDTINRRRAMSHLEDAGMAQDVRDVLFDDMRKVLRPRLTAKTASESTADKFATWVNDNTPLIRDLFPNDPNAAATYVGDLQVLSRSMDRKALRSGITGTREEANPSVLAFTRVAFGPLSRAQRFLTAGRRFQTRKLGEKAIDIISDPAQLRELIQIKQWPIGTRRAVQTLNRLGMGEVYADEAGLPDDFSDPAVQAEFQQHMKDLESAELKAGQ